MTISKTSKCSTERLSAVRCLIAMQDTLSNCRRRLAEFPWDFDGQAAVLKRSDVEAVLQSYLGGQITSGELEEWADLLELREDIDYEEGHDLWLNFVIWSLSDQQLNGPINPAAILSLLAMDEVSVAGE